MLGENKEVSKESTSVITGKQYSTIDQWLVSRTHNFTKKVGHYLEDAEVRWAINDAFFEMQNDLKWYLQREGNNQELIKDFVKKQLIMLYPFIPQTIEELATHYWPEENLTSNGNWPNYEENKIDSKNESLEQILRETRQQLNGRIQKRDRKGQLTNYREVILYVSSKEEKERLIEGTPAIRNTTGIETITVKVSSELGKEDFSSEELFKRYNKIEYDQPKYQFIK